MGIVILRHTEAVGELTFCHSVKYIGAVQGPQFLNRNIKEF